MRRGDPTRVLGVPLRKGKFRNHLRIDGVTHLYTLSWDRARTACGIRYTHRKHLVSATLFLAARTSRNVDCMTCLTCRSPA